MSGCLSPAYTALVVEARQEADEIREFWGGRKDCLNEARIIDALCDAVEALIAPLHEKATTASRKEAYATVNPVATELHAEFPLLWEQAQAFDFAERLGGCSDPLFAEIDRAMHELWLARTNQRAAA
jgi:hypothetical protein